MRIFTMAALAASTLPLAACLGGGGDNDGDVPEYYEEVVNLYEAAEDGEFEEASEEMMSDTATLTGALVIFDEGEDDEEELEIMGDLTLIADFSANTVTGDATNFGVYNEDQELEETISGSLDVVDGVITGTTMTAGFTGMLTGDEEHDVEMYTTAEGGTFYDADGDLAVVGDIEGDIDDDYYEGAFVAIEE